jgi:flagellar capping protein FliD
VSGLTAAINATGDGLTLTDGTTGQAQLIIEDTQGSVAKSMNLAGRFDTATVDRRLEFTVAVTAQDKLNDVMLRLTDLSSAISVNTFGDGTDSSPARMSITSKKSGRAGMLMLSSTVNELQFQQTGAARDAVMLMGGGGAEPQVLRSSSGRFDVLPGVSLEMLGTSAQPVTVTLSRDNSGLADSMQALTDAFNELAELIDTHSSFNVNTFEKGVLHGDSAIRQLETSLRRMMLDPVPGLGNTLNNLGGVGVRIGSDGRVAFDRTSFLSALDTRHDDVVRLFTNSAALTPATSVKKFALGQGLNTGPGADLRVELRDGGVIEIDLDGVTNVEQLLQKMNADSRLEVRVSGDGRKLEFADKTTGSGGFRVLDNNGAGAPVSLGLSSASDSDGDGLITGNDIILGDQLGVGRRLDFDLGAYTSPLDGVFRRLSESADERIAQSNRDIERQEKAVALERDRITRQFISLERYLAQSQTLQTQLASQLKVIEPPGK